VLQEVKSLQTKEWKC